MASGGRDLAGTVRTGVARRGGRHRGARLLRDLLEHAEEGRGLLAALDSPLALEDKGGDGCDAELPGLVNLGENFFPAVVGGEEGSRPVAVDAGLGGEVRQGVT